MRTWNEKMLLQTAKVWKIPLLLCFLAVLLELFVFNYKHWESLFWQGEHIPTFNWLTGEGLSKEENALFRITEAEGEETATIELTDINRTLHNIHISISQENASTAADKAVNIQLKVKDGTSASYFRIPERDIVSGVPKSEYIRLHLCGEVKDILLIINSTEGSLIRIHDISGNVRVPFFFSFGRMFAVMAFLLAGYFLKPDSKVHRRLYVEHAFRGKLIIAVLAALEIFSAVVVAQKNPQSKENSKEVYQQQYQLLAHALAKGQPWLEIEPDGFLAELEDPYDYRIRSAALMETDGTYIWDAAYYQGKYYVYFGVVPEILLFLPYYLITGKDLSTMAVILLEGGLFILGIFALLGTIVRRWFPKTPFSVYLMMALLIVNGSGIWTYFRNPGFYEIPILAALACGSWGLYFWFSSLSGERVSRWRMSFGSLLLAMIAGCRPTLVLVTLLAFPIFWKPVKEKRILGEHKIMDLTCFFAPVLLVAAGLMYYNYVRFGSVTDFGAMYNLTTQNMPQREFIVGMIPMELFTLLFQSPYMTGVFPYYQQAPIVSQYAGTLLGESGFGGVVATNVILIFAFMPYLFRHIEYSRAAYASSFILLGAALVIVVADTQIGGIVPRYLVDFTWLLFLSVAFLFLGWNQKYLGTRFWNMGWLFFLVLFVQSMIFNGLTIFTDVYEKVEEFNPEWFYQAAHQIAFWM
jgi:hypothetical protein